MGSDQMPAPGKTKLIKFPPSRAGKDVKYPGYARGGMLKLRFDWYINLSKLFFGGQQHVYTKKAHFFGGGPYLSRFIATSDNEAKNQDDKN